MQNCISGDVNLGEHIISESLKFCAAIDKEKSSEINRFQRALVRVARLERAASTSQMWRPTNWATPGYLIVMIIPRSGRKSKFFLSVVIYVVKAVFGPVLLPGNIPQMPVLQGVPGFGCSHRGYTENRSQNQLSNR